MLCRSRYKQDEGALSAEKFSANIAITSNYIFRGITMSDDDPAVSGGFDYYGVSLTKYIGNFDFSVAYTNTDDDGETFQGSSTSEVYFTIGATF
jgi:uncharacterized protein Gcw-chp